MEKYMKTSIKHCQTCKTTDESVLHINGRQKSGNINLMCRKCSSDRGKAYRKTPRGKEVWRNLENRQYKKFPQKAIARQALAQAIKRDKIKRPSKCSMCKKTKKVEGHHYDYTKPLDVQWICRQCHFMVHLHV